jgi:hypothetical protein
MLTAIMPIRPGSKLDADSHGDAPGEHGRSRRELRCSGHGAPMALFWRGPRRVRKTIFAES